jgi:hypothetical protein
VKELKVKMINKYTLRFKDKVLKKGFREYELPKILKSTNIAVKIIYGISLVGIVQAIMDLITNGSGIEAMIALSVQAFIIAILYLSQLRFHIIRLNIGNIIVVLHYILINEININFYPQHFLFQLIPLSIYLFTYLFRYLLYQAPQLFFLTELTLNFLPSLCTILLLFIFTTLRISLLPNFSTIFNFSFFRSELIILHQLHVFCPICNDSASLLL